MSARLLVALRIDATPERAFEAFAREHAARHRFPLAAFQQRHAEWWQLLLRSLRTRLRDQRHD